MNRLDYVLVDMDAVRAAQLIENAIKDRREIINKDGVTSFIPITLNELARAGAVIDIDLSLPLRLAMKTPTWYRRRCDTLSRAVWRGQVTDDEAASMLDLWHYVCFRLPYPEGWAQGRIRQIEPVMPNALEGNVA